MDGKEEEEEEEVKKNKNKERKRIQRINSTMEKQYV